MTIPLLNYIVILFGLSVAVLFVCHHFRLPGIIGFIITGILAGPHGLQLVKAGHEVDVLAEIGIVMLLFSIGIEFSFRNLLQIKRSVLVGGPLQVSLAILAGLFIAGHFGQPLRESLFLGFLFSLSSTAIVLKILQGRAEVDSPHGRTSLGILIFQDIIIIPMLLFTPLLAQAAVGPAEAPLVILLKGLVIILLVLISAKWLVPHVLYQIARTRSRELFMLVIVFLCLLVAWLTSSVGLSLAFGAFLAGLIISETEYGHQALSNILPFRDVFASFFFISIGMLLNLGFLFQHPGLIAAITLGVLVVKAVIAGLVTIALGLPLRTAILVGLALCQVGEFSLILSKTGVSYELLRGDAYQIFLNVAIMTMAATPFILSWAPRVADFLLRFPFPSKLVVGSYPSPATERMVWRDHLIIIGYGVNGRNLARAAKASRIPYVIIEMNPETVREEKAKGEPIYYGDAVHEEILRSADIDAARIVVVAINDPTATRAITENARKLNPKIWIIVRTRYLQEMQPLYELGANEVIPEEFETAVEIFARVLQKYLIPRAEIEKFVADVRSRSYEMFRSLAPESTPIGDLQRYLGDVEIATFRLGENAPAAGKSLAEIALRKKHGVTLLALRRDTRLIPNPDPDLPLAANDLLIVLGSPPDISKVLGLFQKQNKGG